MKVFVYTFVVTNGYLLKNARGKKNNTSSEAVNVFLNIISKFLLLVAHFCFVPKIFLHLIKMGNTWSVSKSQPFLYNLDYSLSANNQVKLSSLNQLNSCNHLKKHFDVENQILQNRLDSDQYSSQTRFHFSNCVMPKKKTSRSSSTLRLPPINCHQSGIDKVLSFAEYKEWLKNRRNMEVSSTPVTPLHNNNRARTATLRKISTRSSLSSLAPSHETRKNSWSLNPKQIFSNIDKVSAKSTGSDKSSNSDDSGVFDLSSLNSVLPLPKNKIKPYSELISKRRCNLNAMIKLKNQKL